MQACLSVMTPWTTPEMSGQMQGMGLTTARMQKQYDRVHDVESNFFWGRLEDIFDHINKLCQEHRLAASQSFPA